MIQSVQQVSGLGGLHLLGVRMRLFGSWRAVSANHMVALPINEALLMASHQGTCFCQLSALYHNGQGCHADNGPPFSFSLFSNRLSIFNSSNQNARLSLLTILLRRLFPVMDPSYPRPIASVCDLHVLPQPAPFTGSMWCA